MLLAVFCQLEEYDFRVFDELGHAGDGLFEGREKIVPMKRDNEIRLNILYCLFKELFLRLGIRLRKACYAQEKDICLISVQLSFHVVKARADQI